MPEAYLEIIQAGLATTVQDQGRVGFQSLGVCQVGAADTRLMRLANALVGNHPNAAVLEFSLTGPSFKVCGASIWLAVMGQVKVQVDGEAQAPNTSFFAPEGSLVSLGTVSGHAFAYLAVSSGIEVPLLYNSRSTHVRAGMGGFKGRKLQAADRLALGNMTASEPQNSKGIDPADLLELWKPQSEFAVVLGPQDDAFAPDQIDTFLSSPYEITKESDRMGMRLSGQALKHLETADILSDGIAPGSVQVPGSGLPIVLLADRQTIGGYTKIATLVSCALPVLAQSPPGTQIRFYAVSPDEAIDLKRASEQKLTQMIENIRPLKREPNTQILLNENLISGVVDSASFAAKDRS